MQHVSLQASHLRNRSECSKLATRHECGFVKPRISKLREVFGTREVVEGVPIMNVAPADMEEAEVGEAENRSRHYRKEEDPERLGERFAAGEEKEEQPYYDQEHDTSRSKYLIWIHLTRGMGRKD